MGVHSDEFLKIRFNIFKSFVISRRMRDFPYFPANISSESNLIRVYALVFF